MQDFIASNIKNIREAKHIGQEYMAKRMNIHPTTYSRMENGKTNIKTNRLKQIAKLLEEPVEKLVKEGGITNFNSHNHNVLCGIHNYVYDTVHQALVERIKKLEQENERLKKQTPK